MGWWPFSQGRQEDLTPEDVRARLIAAAAGPRWRLRALCARHKGQVAAHVDLMRKMPEGMATDPASLDRYVQRLGAVAQCLATECGAPELWNELCGTPDNPLLQWERWYKELPRRMEQLEHDELIEEGRSLLEQARSLQGQAARQNEVFLLGRLGELLFHSGKASDAIGPFEAALTRCREVGDIEGQLVYLGNLLEAHRSLGDRGAMLAVADELIELARRNGNDAGPFESRARRLRDGEPPCRIVCVRDGDERELDGLSSLVVGRYEFQFRRNRMTLQKASALVQQGNALATGGRLADALAKYQEAAEVDPHDPDPLYQAGMCLLELGAYAQARESFEEVERIAPGWFRCRSQIWLADSLDNGAVTDDQYRILRALEHGGLDPKTAMRIAREALDAHPDFAPFHLALGELQQNQGETDAAIASYRKGLERVAEPDLEGRLLCSLAGILPPGSPERKTLIERAVGLKGSLVAQAMASLMAIS